MPDAPPSVAALPPMTDAERMIQPGPCIVCGRTNYPLSMGGPGICPACDCGHYQPHVLAWHNGKLSLRVAELEAALQSSEARLEEAERKEYEALTALCDVRERLAALQSRLAAAEARLTFMVGHCASIWDEHPDWRVHQTMAMHSDRGIDREPHDGTEASKAAAIEALLLRALGVPAEEQP